VPAASAGPASGANLTFGARTPSPASLCSAPSPAMRAREVQPQSPLLRRVRTGEIVWTGVRRHGGHILPPSLACFGGAGMPWSEKSITSQRHEFVMLFEQDGVNRRELCRRFGIRPTTGYRLLAHYRGEGKAEMEAQVLALRDEHPAWGGRKIRRRLRDLGPSAPSAGAITAILHRHDWIDRASSAARRPFKRLERAAPNELWQMDYKGHFATAAGRCHPLTVVDDRAAGVWRPARGHGAGRADGDLPALWAARPHAHGQRLAMGSDAAHRHTWLTVSLLEVGVAVSQSRGQARPGVCLPPHRAASDRPGWLLRCHVLRPQGRSARSAPGGTVSGSP
jgi:hypothetical protein